MSEQSAASSSGSTVIDRVFDAAPETVWAHWFDSDRFASWYGPEGATIPVAEFDTNVGGSRRVCMEMATPDGPMQMWFVGQFLEIDAPTRLVYTESMGDQDGSGPAEPDQSTTVVVDLAPDGAGTALRLTHVGVPADSPGAMGWKMAIDKLAALINS